MVSCPEREHRAGCRPSPQFANHPRCICCASTDTFLRRTVPPNPESVFSSGSLPSVRRMPLPDRSLPPSPRPRFTTRKGLKRHGTTTVIGDPLLLNTCPYKGASKTSISSLHGSCFQGTFLPRALAVAKPRLWLRFRFPEIGAASSRARTSPRTNRRVASRGTSTFALAASIATFRAAPRLWL